MLVFDTKQRKLVSGRGFIDFINANKDTIANIAGVAANVANATASTANAAKQIYDIVKHRNPTKKSKKSDKVLTEKSMQILNNLIK